MRSRLRVWHVALVVASAGCERGRGISGVGDSTFVAAMAQLHAIERDVRLDSAGKVAARRVALQERGLSPVQLERAARALAEDPDRAIRVWNRIDSATQKLSGPTHR